MARKMKGNGKTRAGSALPPWERFHDFDIDPQKTQSEVMMNLCAGPGGIGAMMSKNKKYVPYVAELLKDERPEIKKRAATALLEAALWNGDISDGVPQLTEALTDPLEHVKEHCADALMHAAMKGADISRAAKKIYRLVKNETGLTGQTMGAALGMSIAKSKAPDEEIRTLLKNLQAHAYNNEFNAMNNLAVALRTALEHATPEAKQALVSGVMRLTVEEEFGKNAERNSTAFSALADAIGNAMLEAREREGKVA